MDSYLPPTIMQGPLPNSCLFLDLASYWNNRTLNFDTLPFCIPRNVRARIKNTFISDHAIQSNSPRWILISNEIFTCRSFCQYILAKRTGSTRVNLHMGCIWRAKVPNKLKFFLWHIHHNSFPTKVAHSPSCHNCDHYIEDINHLFL